MQMMDDVELLHDAYPTLAVKVANMGIRIWKVRLKENHGTDMETMLHDSPLLKSEHGMDWNFLKRWC